MIEQRIKHAIEAKIPAPDDVIVQERIPHFITNGFMGIELGITAFGTTEHILLTSLVIQKVCSRRFLL